MNATEDWLTSLGCWETRDWLIVERRWSLFACKVYFVWWFLYFSASEPQFKYIYFNRMNLAQKSSIHMSDGTSPSVSPDVMRVISDLHHDLNVLVSSIFFNNNNHNGDNLIFKRTLQNKTWFQTKMCKLCRWPLYPKAPSDNGQFQFHTQFFQFNSNLKFSIITTVDDQY